MNTFKTSLVTACVFGMFVATASGQVRLFMAADGEESTVATTGNTQVTMFPGTSKKIMVWLEDTVQNQELNFYQVGIPWAATPQSGAVGSVAYADNPSYRCSASPYAALCDPKDDSACEGVPSACVDRAGASVGVNEDRPDNVFFAVSANWPPVYLEESPAASATPGVAFLDYLAFMAGNGVEVAGMRYLGEFALRTSPDAVGDFSLPFIPQGGQPAGNAFGSSEQGGGGTYIVTEQQSLAVSVLPASCPGGSVSECCDPNSDGIRNDVCVRCRCDVAPECAFDAVRFADVGGAFGDCEPDGFCNVHDRNHALNCFSGSSACDDLFLDAGGPFGSCAPDGFCNIHDANHALTCFSGTNVCSCPIGPSPEVPPVTVGAARLRVVPGTQVVASGGEIQVRVFVEPSDLSRQPSASGMQVAPAPLGLQSYQLHLGISGGRRGRLELIDIAIEPRRDYVFSTRADAFEAFNAGTGQVLAGVSGIDVPVSGSAYLATLTYRASADAVGTFVADARHSAPPTDQTYLMSSFTDRLEITQSTPAVISVAPNVVRSPR